MITLKQISFVIILLTFILVIYISLSTYKYYRKTTVLINKNTELQQNKKVNPHSTWLGKKKPTVVLLGSSVTEGVGASTNQKSWVGLMNSFFLRTNPDLTFDNLGVPGYTTQDIIRSTLTITRNLNPDVILFENCLINDFRKNFTTIQSEKNIGYIVTTLKNEFPKARIIIMPPNEVLYRNKNKEGLYYQQYVTKVGEYIKYNGWGYIDFWNTYNNTLKEKGLTLEQTLNPDKTHPNDIGYSIWFNSIKSYFEK